MTRPSRPVPDHAHGTNGYCNYKCRCDVCAEAWRAYCTKYRARLAQRPFEEIPHGTNNGYGNYQCRCADCRAAHAEFRRRQREAGGA